MEAKISEDMELWKINSKKILIVKEKVSYVCEKVQILKFPHILKNLRLKVKLFANIFVILLDFDEKIGEILK